MSASTSLYRKYRSQSFDELVGQEPVVRTLKNAIATGRIAHAYLFTGPRGVGKTSAARLLARAANCQSAAEDKPCNQCPNCIAVNRDIATDLIEIDAASNTGVDSIRDVIERAQFAPSVWNTKFYIIDEVHMLSTSAFNALLKTLEEPPPNTSFILATTEIHKVPATVASRCQRFDFRRISLGAMLARVEHVCREEGIEAERAGLELVARHSTGSLRDALSLLDQLRVYSEGGVITLASVQDLLGASGSEEVAMFADYLVAGDLAGGLRQINRIIDEGLDLRQFNRQIVEHLRSLMLVKAGVAGANDSTMLDVTEEMCARLNEQAGKVGMPDLLRWVNAFAGADAAIRSTAYRQLPLELALVEAILKPDRSLETTDQRQAVGARDGGQGAREKGSAPTSQPYGQERKPTPEQANSKSEVRSPHSDVPPPIHTELGTLGNGRQQSVPLPGTNGSNPQTPARFEPPDEVAEVESSSHDASIQGVSGAPQDGSDELARVIRLWPNVVDQIKARSRNMGAIFADPTQVRPVSVRGPLVTISFRYPIHVTRSQDVRAREVIESALTRVLGYDCRVESITLSDAENGGRGDDNPPP